MVRRVTPHRSAASCVVNMDVLFIFYGPNIVRPLGYSGHLRHSKNNAAKQDLTCLNVINSSRFIALFSWEELGARPHRATGATFDGSEDCKGGRKPEIDSNEKRSRKFHFLLITFLLLFPYFTARKGHANREQYVPGELIVKWRQPISRNRLKAINQHRIRFQHPVIDRTTWV